jgi:hypothetical protein
MHLDRIGRGVMEFDLARGETTPIVPMLAALWPSSAQICRRKTETDVFPLVPVIGSNDFGLFAEECRRDARQTKPGIGIGDECARRAFRRPANVRRAQHRHSAARTASAMNALPSARVPASAANR